MLVIIDVLGTGEEIFDSRECKQKVKEQKLEKEFLEYVMPTLQIVEITKSQ